jgi:phenylpropionate dioxygenase-like ring-hydroxylating dioxygenase large terminal subunit
MANFIKNTWYVAAWKNEISNKPLPRTLLNEAIVFYRGADGKVRALSDKCAHRAAPLSLGQIEGNDLRCAYHGVKFNGEGQCVEVPGQAHVTQKMCVRSYPVEEKDSLVWIWMGNPARSDPSLIVSLPWQSSESWKWKPGYVKYAANYQLIIDNLLDLSHVSFVHLRTLGTAATAQQKPEVSETQKGLRIAYWDLNSDVTPLHEKSGMTGKVDRWLIFNWQPPAIFMLDSGSCPTGTGAPAGVRQNGIEFRNTSIQTPETEGSTHYFWTQARNFKLLDAELTDSIHEQVALAFEEDRVIIEAQQHNISSQDPSGNSSDFIGIRADAGPLKARKLLINAITNDQ